MKRAMKIIGIVATVLLVAIVIVFCSKDEDITNMV